jgi:serine/tyrosine/threonine adenylyltransferase
MDLVRRHSGTTDQTGVPFMPPMPFDNTYARLPERFHVRLNPTPVAAPRILRVNLALAEELGVDPAALTAEVLAGNRVADGAEPLAAAYAGHQFGHFNPALGDGRAVLLGEVVTPSGLRRDIQLKGAGPTPWSRGGDGRAAVGPVLREYIVSEAMAALGIPTTRALAAVATGEPVYRETALPGAVLTRVAASHIRVGTFQYFAARGDAEAVKLLADHVIARHYPDAASAPNPYAAMLEGVIARQANLIANWLLIGFIHGVMNTDNCAVSGETIDFGPCAFLDEYDPAKVFSSIDRQGRYAYGNQPRIAVWNLARLAETMLPLLHENEDTAVGIAQDLLAGFSPRFEAAYFGGLRRKIGLTKDDPSDVTLVNELLKLMAESEADFTRTFRRLCDAATGDDGVRDDFTDAAAFDQWAARWRWRMGDEADSPEAIRAAMRAVNPAFIPRNHQVEAALNAAIERDDLSLFESLLTVLARPFDDQPDQAHLAAPPAPAQRVTKTFCGT